MKIVIIIFIIAILGALFSAFIGMNKGVREGSDKMFKSLSTRVGLSVFLFILLMFSGYMGWIKPNGVNLDQRPHVEKPATSISTVK